MKEILLPLQHLVAVKRFLKESLDRNLYMRHVLVPKAATPGQSELIRSGCDFLFLRSRFEDLSIRTEKDDIHRLRTKKVVPGLFLEAIQRREGGRSRDFHELSGGRVEAPPLLENLKLFRRRSMNALRIEASFPARWKIALDLGKDVIDGGAQDRVKKKWIRLMIRHKICCRVWVQPRGSPLRKWPKTAFVASDVRWPGAPSTTRKIPGCVFSMR